MGGKDDELFTSVPFCCTHLRVMSFQHVSLRNAGSYLPI